MRSFDEIFAISATRKGGADTLEALLDRPLPPEEIARSGDDRWLAAMVKCLFQAGFHWKVIEAKWDGFESAFGGFVPAKVALYGDADMDRLLADEGVVRNGAKLAAVISNAVFLTDLARDHGSAARFFADWPDADYVGLLDLLAKRGARLGGVTGQRVLRMMGKSAFILSSDVTARLIAEGVVDKAPTSKRDLAAVQAAFNDWQAQSGRSLTEISQVLAMSIG
ncbi:DNA-3-methyladenine glycosylase I [Defluviimonas aestuarii]|uniref:DNA-3-methyladenine glycosylase I n=1 Tax=Albidovulum aestuarii TaxID=1130726 RepID=UPI00249B8880|nr:DNA-3-methyladenine glycosylase I [Defluviimonas aestuarii]MDI3337555.1 DNA-3-methyladenine glycosylase I [Defluviimonas aestuarii]